VIFSRRTSGRFFTKFPFERNLVDDGKDVLGSRNFDKGEQMTSLDGVFSGAGSVTDILAELFAGNAMVVCPGKQGAYDPVTNTHEQEAPVTYPVKFFEDTRKQTVWSHVGGIQIEAGDLIGSIPAHQIKEPLRRTTDRLERGGVIYLIKSTEEISSGDKTALVRVLCKRI